MDSLACRYQSKLLHAGWAFMLSLAIGGVATARADVSQSPLLLGGGSVPGNLALVPSVEWPTIISMANLGAYSVNNSYVGYFDSNKCYDYSHDATNADRRDSHFFPKSITSNRSCAGNLWSGNFLNWAATQTIDPFRSALTGGYRVRDTPTETWLEKARHTGQQGTGSREISGGTTVGGATPANWSHFRTHLAGLGNRMRFTMDGNLNGAATPYASTTDLAGNGSVVYEVVMRVKVCDADVGLESNCKQYSRGYKPEGLIQQYASDIRYSVFGYLNDHDILRDGGVLRAKQKFVGQAVRTPGVAGNQDNLQKEWDPITGELIQNPDKADARDTSATILDSGVINYLNKFGQMTSGLHKHYDPVSELYYTALRYFKNQGNVPAYSNLTGDANNRYQQADGFPVITNWGDDPIQYACQKNVILGIGDANTHRDKNLPGNTVRTDEPAVPAEVAADDTIDVVRATQKVAQLEGITLNTPFTGRENSAYIAGLAYDAHTKDIRSAEDDWAGDQTVSTYWVDVRENEWLEPRARNQYWLATKYGGFKVPEDFKPYERTTALPSEWWHTTGDMLDQTGDPRPDNFYVASDAKRMVESLKLAFAQIAKDSQSTLASLAANSTRLTTDTALFQSELDSKRWSGNLLAKRIDGNGKVASGASWSAATALDNLTNLDSRKIFTSPPPTADSADGPRRSTSGADFTWSGLTAAQQAALTKAGEADSSMAQNRLAFLRGDRSLEITDSDPTQPFRQRASRLGDIVNSDPQYIHKQDFGYSRLGWSNGAVGEAYTAFRTSTADRTPMVIVGANDGMLHGFDARVSATAESNGGRELFAYVPNNVFGNLINLTEPAYAHRYYVDGTPRVSDVWLGGTTGWRTMVVGSTGAGGNSIFALDITNPGNMTRNSVKWEFSHPRMGYTIGQPALVALPNEQFGVIVSSGYHDSAQTDGKVWVLSAADGSVIKEFTLATTGGLGGPLAADTDADQVADRVYVADTLGNLWRLDLAGSDEDDWGAPSSLNSNPLFIAKNDSNTRQAITAPLASAFNEKGQHMVFFGTGSFYRTGDNEVPTNPPVDTFYGIIDGGLMIDGRRDLREQEILRETTTARAITQNAMQSADKGWYLDLTGRGERVVAKATLRSDRVIFTTMIPSADPCDPGGGTSWVMAVNLSSGGRLNYVYFDTNGDGNLDSEDTTAIGTGDEKYPWSGISNETAGVSKGTTEFLKWWCTVGSSGAAPTCYPKALSPRFGRQSWREVGSY